MNKHDINYDDTMTKGLTAPTNVGLTFRLLNTYTFYDVAKHVHIRLKKTSKIRLSIVAMKN